MRRKVLERSWARTVGQALAVALVTFLLAPGWAQASGTCTTANVDEPFRLPDGSLHAGGMLTLCLERTHSPVAAMHEVRVNGMAIGLFMSRPGTAEGMLEDDAGAFMMFHRLAGGELLLFGVANPLRDRMQLHYLGYGSLRAQPNPPDQFALANDPTTVIVAARTL